MTMRRWGLAWVLFALVCAQALGLMHRVAHAHAGAADSLAHAASQAETSKPGSWLGELFAHADDHGCRLLDGAGQCGAPPVAAAPLPPLPHAAVPLPAPQLALAAARAAPFQARAPPLSR
jgi:hypothetical protein